MIGLLDLYIAYGLLPLNRIIIFKGINENIYRMYIPTSFFTQYVFNDDN